MTIKFLTDYPALFIPDKKILVVAELHIGLEYELYKSGIVISPQVEKFQKILNNLIKTTKAKVLVIIGDTKHEVPGISFRELKEIPKLFSHLVEIIDVIIVKGNHDTFLEDAIPTEIKTYSSRGLKIEKYGFFHGHAWPSKKLMDCDHLFMAHLHPLIEFKDKLGHRSIQQVWIKSALDKELIKNKYKVEKTGRLEITILPTFNKLLGGLILNKTEEELHGPLFSNKILDMDKSNMYLLDGTLLGTIKDLKKFE